MDTDGRLDYIYLNPDHTSEMTKEKKAKENISRKDAAD